MDRTRLLAEMAAAQAPPEEVLYLERLGEEYRWGFVPTGAMQAGASRQPGEPAPDAWMFYSGPWAAGPADEMSRFAEDLLAEMESMCGGADRCRWPLDQPYPMRH